MWGEDTLYDYLLNPKVRLNRGEVQFLLAGMGWNKMEYCRINVATDAFHLFYPFLSIAEVHPRYQDGKI